MFRLGDSKLTHPQEYTSRLDAFAGLLAHRLRYLPGERDAVIMHHEFGIVTADGKKVIF